MEGVGRFKKTKSVTMRLTDAENEALLAEAKKLGYDKISDYLFELHRRQAGRIPLTEITKGQTSLSQCFPKEAFKTKLGTIYQGDSSILMNQMEPQSVDLIMTSPPYGLVKKKDYGNEDNGRYLAWFEDFAEGFKRALKPEGSLVIDIGGAWKEGQPTRSLYHFELLIKLCKEYGFHLAQEFYWWNPAKLPTPAEWVNVRRIRVKDAVNCIWWLSPTPYPKASNRRILQPYTESMEYLLDNGYRPKVRPSGHKITGKFMNNVGGAIPPNLLALANQDSRSAYHRYCQDNKLKEHPARFPQGIPAFFIKMLTNPGDLILDPFAGSCVTGEVCERMGRRWVCCEIREDYVKGALGRFPKQEKLLPLSVDSKRAEPYSIYPPLSLPINEDEVPLVKDGGRGKPQSRAERAARRADGKKTER